MDTIGKRFRRCREAAGLNQTEAAAALRISGPHLSKVEKDGDRPSLDLTIRAAVLYRVPMEALADDDEELSGVEVAAGEQEVDMLRAFRAMPDDERAALTRLVKRKPAA